MKITKIQRIDESGPSVGSFFWIDGKLASYPEEVRDLKFEQGTWVNSNLLHMQLLDMIRRKYPEIKDDYAYYPRGRVIFNKDQNKYYIYLDKCIKKPNIEKMILSRFNLRYQDYVILEEEHYTCPGCDPDLAADLDILESLAEKPKSQSRYNIWQDYVESEYGLKKHKKYSGGIFSEGKNDNQLMYLRLVRRDHCWETATVVKHLASGSQTIYDRSEYPLKSQFEEIVQKHKEIMNERKIEANKFITFIEKTAPSVDGEVKNNYFQHKDNEDAIGIDPFNDIWLVRKKSSSYKDTQKAKDFDEVISIINEWANHKIFEYYEDQYLTPFSIYRKIEEKGGITTIQYPSLDGIKTQVVLTRQVKDNKPSNYQKFDNVITFIEDIKHGKINTEVLDGLPEPLSTLLEQLMKEPTIPLTEWISKTGSRTSDGKLMKAEGHIESLIANLIKRLAKTRRFRPGTQAQIMRLLKG